MIQTYRNNVHIRKSLQTIHESKIELIHAPSNFHLADFLRTYPHHLLHKWLMSLASLGNATIGKFPFHPSK